MITVFSASARKAKGKWIKENCLNFKTIRSVPIFFNYPYYKL